MHQFKTAFLILSSLLFLGVSKVAFATQFRLVADGALVNSEFGGDIAYVGLGYRLHDPAPCWSWRCAIYGTLGVSQLRLFSALGASKALQSREGVFPALGLQFSIHPITISWHFGLGPSSYSESQRGPTEHLLWRDDHGYMRFQQWQVTYDLPAYGFYVGIGRFLGQGTYRHIRLVKGQHIVGNSLMQLESSPQPEPVAEERLSYVMLHLGMRYNL